MARKILLADDSVTAQNMGRKILTDAGYEVITVNNGSAALKKIAEGKPDLIVLDVYMPGYSGLEVCQRIKENRETSRIPILLTVGKLEPFKPEEARRARADAFVVKPFEASELLAALTKLEDKIIPGAEPYKPGRFAKAIASVERDDTDSKQLGDGDEGWKARLRIPTGPPKERDPEPPVDYAATQGKGFRDLIEPPARKNSPKPAAPAAFERPVPAGLPHDITPEEIAAITAAAAQLKGGPPAVAEVDAPASKAEPETGPPGTAHAPEITREEAAPVTFASAPDLEAASARQNEPAPSLEPIAEIPVELASDISLPADVSAVAETLAVEGARMIAEQTPSEAPATQAVAEIVVEPVQEIPAVAVGAESTPPDERVTESQRAVSASAEPSVMEPKSTVTPATPPAPVTVAETAPAETSPPAPADDEVMAALHALIPADSQPGQTSTAPNCEASSTSAASVVPEHVAPHWIAQEIPLSAEEAMLALDREMATIAAQVTREPGSAPEAVAQDRPEGTAAEAKLQQTAQEGQQAYAVATAVGAGFPSPWPIGTRTDTPDSAAAPALSASPAEAITEPAELHSVSAETPQVKIETEPMGGTEIMAASWKNIRDSIAGSAAKPAPAKEEFAEAPAASANAVPESHPAEPGSGSDGTATKPAANDPTAIANIVESVLAELRPKIVEEIARKLTDTKK